MRLEERGQTIIELLISIAIVGIVVISVAAALTFSIKNSAEVRYRASATSLAQEAIEFFRHERASMGWNAFSNAIVAPAPPGSTFCFDSIPTSIVNMYFGNFAGACTAAEKIDLPAEAFDPGFYREVQLAESGGRVEITATVRWISHADQYSQVVLKQNLEGWDAN